MIPEEAWNAMSPAQREQAWADELAAMIEKAIERFRGSLSAGANTRVDAGAFNIVVSDLGGAPP